MRKVGRLAAACGLLAVLLVGCGQAGISGDVQEPTLDVSAEGQVTAYLVGEFDRSYYDLDELTEMAKAEAAAYGGSPGGSAPVRVENVEAAGDGSNRIVVTYIFDSTENYEGFIGERLFYGTVAEAIAQGYNTVTLQSARGDDVITAAELAQEPGRHLIVTDTAADIYCPYSVTHVSQGAVLNADGSVDATQVRGLVYILMSN